MVLNRLWWLFYLTDSQYLVNLLTLSQKVGKSGRIWKNIYNFVPNEEFHWNI